MENKKDGIYSETHNTEKHIIRKKGRKDRMVQKHYMKR